MSERADSYFPSAGSCVSDFFSPLKTLVKKGRRQESDCRTAALKVLETESSVIGLTAQLWFGV